MDPNQLGHLPHAGHQPVGGRAQRVEVVAVEAELERGDVLVVQLLELDVGVGEAVGPGVGILVEQRLGILDGGGVDDKLGVVLAGNLRRVAHLEAGRRAADERGDGAYARVDAERLVDRVGHGGRPFERGPVTQVDFHGELVTVGIGEHPQPQLGGEQQGDRHRGDAERDGEPSVAEGPHQNAPVEALHAVGEAAVRGVLPGRTGDDEHLEEGNHHHGQQQRYHQVDGNRPREVGDEVAHDALHGEEDGVEDDADAEGGQQQRGEELAGALDGRIPARIAPSEVVEVAVDDHNRVVDNHAQHDNQRGERHRVERDAAGVHQPHGDEGREGDGDGCHDGRAPREEEHHHHDDDGHGDEQVAQERRDGVADDLRLVGDARHVDVRRKHLLGERVEHLVDLAPVLHDVVSVAHLHREQHAAVAVVEDVAVGVVVSTLDARHIAYAEHVALGVAPDDLVGNLLLAAQRRGEVDRGLGAAHGGQPLRGERRREHLLADAVGGQPVVVDVDGYLLRLEAVGAEVRDRLDAAQPVAQLVEVLLQFAVAARVGFERDEQRRGVAKVVVGHERHHAPRQLCLEGVEAVLDFRPDLVLVVDVILQLDHDVAHAVLRGGGGLRPLDLLVGHQELLERAGQLFLDLFAGGARIEAHHYTLADGVLRKLLFRNVDKPEDAEQEEAPDEQEGDAEVAHRPRHEVV